MVLPSQFGRPVSRRRYMYRRKRRRSARRALWVLLAIILTLATWQFWPVQRPPGDGGAGSAEGPRADLTANRTGFVATPPEAKLTGQTPKPGSPPARASARANDRPQHPAMPAKPRRSSRQEPTPERPAKPTTTTPAPATVVMGRPEPERPASSAPPAASRSSTPRAGANRPSAPAAGPSRRAAIRYQESQALIASNRPVEARQRLTALLAMPGLDAGLALRTREALAEVNERLVFTPEIVPDDPFAMEIVIEPGDSLSRIARRLSLQVEWQFLQRVNRISNAKLIRAGQRIKVITGPFHAVVDKSDFRLDLYLGDGPDRVFVRSFPVGLGQFNSTPQGFFRVRQHSKLINPQWRNPRTNELFLANDPANPIGEHWIGLEGIDAGTRDLRGYGVHGTIDPDSIGQQASMGCVRMRPDDVALIWEVLVEGVSEVEIRP